MASAEELFGAGAGRAAGLEAWRIESMKPASNAEAARGRFHEGGRTPPPPPLVPLWRPPPPTRALTGRAPRGVPH